MRVQGVFLDGGGICSTILTRYGNRPTDTYLKESQAVTPPLSHTKQPPNIQFINATSEGIAPTIKANYWKMSQANLIHTDGRKSIAILEIMEEPQIKQIGSYSPSSACNAKVLDSDGICPTLLKHKGAEPAILTPQRSELAKQLRREGIEAFAHRELVPREDGVSNTLTSVQKDNMVLEPLVGNDPRRIYGKQDWNDEISPALMAVDYKAPKCVIEPNTVIGSNQANAFVGSVEGVAPCVNAAAGMGGGHVPMVTEGPKIVGYTRDDKGRVESYHFKETANTLHTGGGTTAQYVAEQNKTNMYRIRKLTPKECFRLMDVEDADIEKIEAYPWKSYDEREEALCGLSGKERKRERRKCISKSAKYELAGNSIVVSCLYNIFRTLFIDNQPENERQQGVQLSLFD